MTPERLTELMHEAPVPESAEVRERVVAVARAEAESRTPARSRARRPRRFGALIAVALLGLGLLTPPGRAAIDKAAELVGIGDVGGPPSGHTHRGIAPRTKPVVVDNGRAPDGVPYEWVAYRGGLSYRVEGKKVRFRGFCVGLEWPDKPKRHGAGAGCSERGDQSGGPWDMIGIFLLDSGDVVVTGGTTADVHRVRIGYRDLAGRSHDIPVDFARVDGTLLRRAGGRLPFGTLMAFVPARQVQRDRLATRFRLGSILPPSPPVPKRFRKGPLYRCTERYGTPPTPTPFEVTVYGAGGRVIEHERWVQAHLAPRRCMKLERRLSERATSH